VSRSDIQVCGEVDRDRAWRADRCRRRVARLAAIVVLTGLLAGLAIPSPAGAQQAPPSVPMDASGMPRKTFFPETGHHLNAELLDAWRSTGLMIFGYPISEPFVDNGRTVQYFERARLEHWPEYAGTQWEVQGTLLGNLLAQGRRDEPPFRPLPPGTPSDSPDRIIFQETGHSLAFGFKRYWEEHGGLWQFGFPISEEFSERNPQDGKTYTVQYFERARFEWHPENAGTEYEILLGHLGRDFAEQQRVPTTAVEQQADAVRYSAKLFDDRFLSVFHPTATSWQAYVSTDAVGIRIAPDSAATTLDVIYNRRPIEVRGIVRGGLVEGIDAWYVVGDGEYVSAAYLDPLVLQTPPQYFAGHWVDISLSSFYAVAYNGTTAHHVAIIAAGRDGKTPVGVFNIQTQILNETMDSATVGIPPGAPGYYYLENVLYTQYFLAGGYALHGNYWTPEASFGNFTSNGCVGLMNADAEFFWNWLYVGDVVSIHY
jgi:hypothetical protein